MFDTKYGIHAKQLILNNNLMNKMVKIYNKTPHHAFDYMFSPLEVQEHPEVMLKPYHLYYWRMTSFHPTKDFPLIFTIQTL
jgi:hypothetical protein